MGKLGPFEKILGGMTSPRYIRIRVLKTRVLTGLTCMIKAVKLFGKDQKFPPPSPRGYLPLPQCYNQV